MALKQTLSGWNFESHKKDAVEKYPDEDPEKALERHAREEGIEGIFFLNQAGERCRWGPGK